MHPKYRYMQMINERYNEEDFKGFVEELVKSYRLSDIETGISKRMLDKGYDSLSDKQKYVFDKMIMRITVKECKRCGVDIPWCEMMEALDNGGYCNYCQHMMEKDD